MQKSAEKATTTITVNKIIKGTFKYFSLLFIVFVLSVAKTHKNYSFVKLVLEFRWILLISADEFFFCNSLLVCWLFWLEEEWGKF